MANPTLKAEKRKIFGRKVKTLRKGGILPANIYGKKVKSTAVELSLTDFRKVFEQEGETGLVDLKMNGDILPVLIHHVQKDSISGDPIHADFLQVNLKEKVSATVPIEFVGESPAEKSGEGIIVAQMNEVEVEALPTNLPEKIVVDVSLLQAVDDAIKVSQLPIDRENIELKADPKRIVVNVAPPAQEEEVAPKVEETVTEAEGEGVSKAPVQEAGEEQKTQEAAKEDQVGNKEEKK